MQAEAEIPIRRPKKMTENASQIECIEFGGWEIDTWYAAPYPAEYSRNRVLYICEFCLKYMNSDFVAWRHKVRCLHCESALTMAVEMRSPVPARR